jgi:hypothetical protein
MGRLVRTLDSDRAGGRSGCRRWLVPCLSWLIVAGMACFALPGAARAAGPTPKVLPDRIADVPATQVDPFPDFANFSWRAFIALNWPALTGAEHRGQPDRYKAFGDPGPRVWETFKSRYEVFQRGPDGHARVPAPWASYLGRNPCGPGVDNRAKTVSAFTPYADFNQVTFKTGVFGSPLVAQNRTYTRYEVRVNRTEFDSIVAHQWYIRGKLPTLHKPGRFLPGSVEVKAAWRLLNGRDGPAVRKRYYIAHNAEVLDVAKSRRAGHPVCAPHDLALVGLHIVIKTTYRPQWIWSSFEQVDNVPPAGKGAAREPDAKDAHLPYAYNNPALPQKLAAHPLPPVSMQNLPKLNPEPTQVVRLHPINADIMAMNRAYWALPQIRNTVWRHYMLVTTQWPTTTVPDAPSNSGNPFPGGYVDPTKPVDVYQLPKNAGPPPELANTTMETYLQAPQSSCMACHYQMSNARGRDFVTFMDNDANPAPKKR